MAETQVTGRQIKDKSVFDVDIDLSLSPVHPNLLISDKFIILDPTDNNIKISTVANLNTYLDTRYSGLGHTHAYLPLVGGTMSNSNLVTNLNADLLDGQHGSYYSPTSHTHNASVLVSGYVHNDRLYGRYGKASYYCMLGEANSDTSMIGLFDRNELALSDKRGIVTVTFTGAGTGVSSLGNLFDGSGAFATLEGVNATTTKVEVLIEFPTNLPNYGRGLWQPFLMNRIGFGGGGNWFKKIKVEVSSDGTTWSTTAGWQTTDASTSSAATSVQGLWMGSDSGSGNYAFRFVRFTLEDLQLPTPIYGVWIAQIGLRHVSAPFTRIYVRAAGDTIYGQLSSAVPQGTAPFTVVSNTLVTNLNADLLDGQHGSYYASSGSLGGYVPYTGATGNVTLGTYSLTTSNIIGGTSTTQDLSFKTTSGVGATGADMHFLVGNNGATEAMTILNNGNVGIGTTNPNTKLQVSTANSEYIPSTASFSIQKLEEGYGLFAGISPNGRTWLQSGTKTGETKYDLVLNPNGGNVGIGTRSPSYKLEVAGNTIDVWPTIIVSGGRLDAFAAAGLTVKSPTGTLTSGLYSYNNQSSGWGYYGQPTTAEFSQLETVNGPMGIGTRGAYGLYLGTNSSNVMTLTSGGNVGIGTTAPLKTLHVANDLTYSQSQSGQLYVGGATDINKRLMLGYDTTNNFGFIEGINFGTSYSSVIINPYAGNVGIGTTSPTATLHLKAGTASPNTAPLKLTAGTNLTIAEAGALEWNGTNLFITQTTGPTRKTIAYTSDVSGSYVPYTGATTDVNLGSRSLMTPLLIGGISGTSRITYKSTTSGGTLTAIAHQWLGGTNGNIEIATMLNNGNVGIGDASPEVALSVNGSTFINVGEDENAFVIHNDPNANNQIKVNGDNNNVILSESSGNVGIGVSIPLTKLDVQGNLTIGSRFDNNYLIMGYDMSGGEVGIYAYDPTEHYLIGLYNNLIGIGSDPYNPFVNITSTGNVGIGTTDPGEKLVVLNGRVLINSTDGVTNPALVIAGSANSGETWNIGVEENAASSGTLFFNNSTDLAGAPLVVTNTGSVGIGRSDPYYPLDVIGTIRFGEPSNGHGILASGTNNTEFGLIDENDCAIAVEYSNDGSFQYGGSLGTSQGIHVSATGEVGINSTDYGAGLYISTSLTSVLVLTTTTASRGFYFGNLNMISTDEFGMYDYGSDTPLVLYDALTDIVHFAYSLSVSTSNSTVGIGQGVISTAMLHIGVSTVDMAPLKFTTSPMLTTPQSGAVEWNGSNLYITQSNSTRKTIAYTSDIPGSYSLPLAANGTRGGIQIGFTATGASLPLLLSSEKGYITLSKSAVENVLTGEIFSHTHAYSATGHNHDDRYFTETESDNRYPILSGGIIPNSYLPSYVDDVLEYASLVNLPVTGDSGKIYITADTNLTYRWSGSAYVLLSASLALGETSATAYRGDRGKIAYDHSQVSHTSGTVTSIGITVPTGLTVSPASITTSGTFAISIASGYYIPNVNYLPLSGGTMSNSNLVTNLNADLLDGQHGSYYVDIVTNQMSIRGKKVFGLSSMGGLLSNDVVGTKGVTLRGLKVVSFNEDLLANIDLRSTYTITTPNPSTFTGNINGLFDGSTGSGIQILTDVISDTVPFILEVTGPVGFMSYAYFGSYFNFIEIEGYTGTFDNGNSAFTSWKLEILSAQNGVWYTLIDRVGVNDKVNNLTLSGFASDSAFFLAGGRSGSGFRLTVRAGLPYVAVTYPQIYLSGIAYYSDGIVNDSGNLVSKRGGSIYGSLTIATNLTVLGNASIAGMTKTGTNVVTNLNADLLDGNHASAFALSGHTHPTTMVYPGAGIAVSTGSAWGTSIANNSANWNTAYGWGNHTGLYSLSTHNHTLDGLSNTTITSNSNGEILKWNGTAWVNNTLSEAGIEPTLSAGTTLQYLRGDKTWQTLNTVSVVESTNLYFTTARARTSISLTTTGTSGAATYSDSTGVLNIPNYATGSGTVTSIGMSVPTGLSVTPASITTSGTFAVTFASGYAIPTTAKQTQWDTAYTHSQVSHQAIINGTGFVKASGTTLSYDNSTYSISTHSHTLASLTDTTITSVASGEILKWSGSAWINNTLVEAGIAPAIHTHAYDNYANWSCSADGIDTELIVSGKRVNFIGDGNGISVNSYDVSGTHTLRFDNTKPFPGFGTTVGTAAYGNHNHTIDSLTDTTITSIASGEILKWNGSAWINNTLAEAGIQAVGAMSLASLSDTTITSVASGELLKWSGTKWINNTLAEAGVAAASHTHLLGDLTNVTLTSVVSGEVLKWNGSAWINNTLAEAGIAAAVHTHSYDNYGSWELQGGGSTFDVTAGNYVNFSAGTGIEIAWNATYHKLTISNTIANGSIYGIMPSNYNGNTTGGQIAGLSATVPAAGVYEVEAVINAYVSADAYGVTYSVWSGTGTFTGGISGTTTASADSSVRMLAKNTYYGAFLKANSLNGQIIIKGIYRATGNDAVWIYHKKLTSGTCTAVTDSYIKLTKIG